jgi:sugar phosphate isomerase/epimerase
VRISISNIAWDPSEDEAIAALLRQNGIDAIDVAPGKYFPAPAKASAAEIARVKGFWAERGIAVTGMQALLFGTQGLNLFGSAESREAMLGHLATVCRIAAGLGATRLVFGSPKNRDRGSLGQAEAEAIAVPFFGRLGDIAASSGVVICLEPNPTRYGANFMTTSAETAGVVQRTAHPAIRMQLDTGALTINGEDPDLVLRECGPLIGHVHLSEPDLVPLGDGGTEHPRMTGALSRFLGNPLVTIEMVATTKEPHLTSIQRALEVAKRHYGAGGAA